MLPLSSFAVPLFSLIMIFMLMTMMMMAVVVMIVLAIPAILMAMDMDIAITSFFHFCRTSQARVLKMSHGRSGSQV